MQTAAKPSTELNEDAKNAQLKIRVMAALSKHYTSVGDT